MKNCYESIKSFAIRLDDCQFVMYVVCGVILYNYAWRVAKMKMQNMPSFNEDDFDLIEHKNAATSNTQAKARIKRDRRKVSIGRIVVMLVAFVVCALLYFMVSAIVGRIF